MNEYKYLNDFSDVKQFFFDISHQCSSIYGGLIEVVLDFTMSQYFDAGEQLDDLVQFAIDKANAGQQVFFGPATRKDDLGANRSSVSNAFSSLVLWVDIDPPDKDLPSDQQMAASRALLDDFVQRLNGYGIQPSYIVESGHGFHVYFLLKKFHRHPDSAWQNAQNALVKIAKGDTMVRQPASLLRVPGTFNYKDPENPKPVRIMDRTGIRYDIGDFGLLIADMVKASGASKTATPVGDGKGKLGFIPPCIANLLDPSNKPPLGHRHQIRQILSTYGFNEGWPLEDAIQKVIHTTDDPKKAERDVEGIYKVLERDPERYSVGCGEGSDLRALVDSGIAVCDEQSCRFKNPEVAKEDGKKEELSAWFDGLVEIVSDDTGGPKFLIKDGDSLVVKDRYEMPKCVYLPPPSQAIVWTPPRVNNVMNHITADSDQQLFTDLVEYHKGISELPDENYYRFLAAWDMHTYLMEKFEYSPIIWLHAIPARGKSRTAKGITYVSWRGIILNTVREAHIIRLATNQRATLFFDIMDLWKKIERAGIDDIMLNRFERGGKVARVMNPELGAFQDTKWFDIYGPTIIATNKMIDDILETRSIQIIMPETTRTFERDVKEIDALPLRERLTAFRARRIDCELPLVEKPLAGRLGDILKPIRQIVNLTCSDESWFLDFAKDEADLKRSESVDTDDARVVTAIVQALGNVEHGHLLHSHILNAINSGLSEQFKMTPQKLGRITKRLGFRRYSSGSLRGIVFNQGLLDRLCQRYGVRPDSGLLTI
jgi:hypothetical protein